MKEKKTNLLQVLARRALLVALDGAIVAFSFYFALLLRADGAVEASWWPHNRALLYANLPWIVAVYLLSFLAGRLYTILWKYAGERDLIRLAGMIAVPTGIVYLVNRCFIHGVLFNSANAMAAVIQPLMTGGQTPWMLYFCGAALALVLTSIGVPALAFALGMFIPMELNAPLVVGGLVAWFVSNRSKDEGLNKARFDRGTLIASGFIAGGALMGVVSALLKFAEADWFLSGWADSNAAEWTGLAMYLVLIGYFAWHTLRAKKEE